MWNRLKAVGGLLLLPVLLNGHVYAADAKTDAAEAAAAMERAKRQAANPLRVILEAGKVRRRVVAEPEPEASQTAEAAARRAAAKPAAAADARVISTTAVVPLASSSRDAPTPPPKDEEPAARQPALLTMPHAPVAEVRTAAVVAALQPQGAQPAPSTVPMVDLPAAPTVAANALNPRLIEMIEPVIPQRVLAEIGRAFEVEVDVTIRADGSVAAADVLKPAPRQVARHVVAAVERWRFEAGSAERRHRVQLVFNAP